MSSEKRDISAPTGRQGGHAYRIARSPARSPALAVLLYHAIPSTRDYGFRPSVLFEIIGWGYQGVDIFFVISGFVMILTETRRNRSAGAFLIDRLSRIAPLYWLMTLLLFAMLVAMPSLFRSMSADPVILLRSLTFTNFLIDPDEGAADLRGLDARI